jgi:hydroxymethylbilane synthase
MVGHPSPARVAPVHYETVVASEMPQPSASNILRLGTRGSLLARTQSMLVAHALEREHPGLRVEMRSFKTSGDQVADRPLHEIGGKGLFTKELEQALLAGDIDFAVHSFKDVPVTMPLVDQGDLFIAAVPTREDPRDVLVSRKAKRLRDLPMGARVGTGSLRRKSQISDLRRDLMVEPLRGNIDTRLRKLNDGQFDAIVLALAGLKRTELFDVSLMQPVDVEELLPAPGQGALALQCRRSDARTSNLLGALNDETSATCVEAERRLVKALEGDCHSPIAALATIAGGQITLRAAVGRRDGKPPVVEAIASSARNNLDGVVGQVYQSLLAQGAPAMLAGDA